MNDDFQLRRGYQCKIIHKGVFDHRYETDRLDVNALKAALGHPRIVVNARDSYGNTALLIACDSSEMDAEDTEKVKVLLAAGADPRISNSQGYSPIDAVMENMEFDRNDANRLELIRLMKST